MSEVHEVEVDQRVIAKLRGWIEEKNKRATNVGLDTDLINEGALDSLQMVNFLLFIEELRGEEIPEAMVRPVYFVSLRKIHDSFFRKQPSQR